MPYGLGPPSPPPQRGWPGGWRDWWERDKADDAAQARAARFAAETARVRAAWQREPKPSFGRTVRASEPAASSGSSAPPA
jgi:hypothetical protein